MDQQQTARLLKTIQNIYPNFKLNQDILTVWTKALQDTQEDDAQRNLEKYFKTSKYPPHVSDIANDRAINYAQLEYEQLQREAEANQSAVIDEEKERRISERLNRIRETMRNEL